MPRVDSLVLGIALAIGGCAASPIPQTSPPPPQIIRPPHHHYHHYQRHEGSTDDQIETRIDAIERGLRDLRDRTPTERRVK